jgi:hypothetical protein
MRRIVEIDEKGEVVRVFDSVKETAEALGITTPSVIKRIHHLTLKDGTFLMYEDGMKMPGELLVKEANFRRKILEKRAMERKAKQLGEKMESKENMSDEVFNRTKEEWLAQGVDLEVIPYETIRGVISKTPCEKFDWESRGKVGTMFCSLCRFFRGKNKKRHEVLCAHRHYLKKSSEENRGRKKK